MKVKFSILGERVHKVGYRAVLLSKAFSLGIDYFSVFNFIVEKKQAIIVLVDCGEEQIEELRNFIESYKPEKAVVKEIKEEEYKAKVPSIDRAMQAFQTEQWSEGIPILLEIRDSARLIPEIAENTSLIPEMAGNIKEMRERQDEHIAITKDGFDGVVKELKGFKELHEELRELRQEVNELRGAVARIEKKVAV